MNKESKLNLNAGDYAISHCDSNKTYNGLELHKMLCDAYIAGNNDTLDDKDEEIRKALINVFATHKDYEMFFGVSVKDIRAWLEEQGEKSNWKPSNEEMDVLYGLAYITNKYDEHKEEVITRLYQDLKREFFNGSSYENMFPNTEDDVRRRSTIQVLEYARSLDTYNQYGKADINKNIAWLERQGEKKPQRMISAEEKEAMYDKPAWSEEDEDFMYDTLSNLTELKDRYGEGYGNVGKCIDWLKSLKKE